MSVLSIACRLLLAFVLIAPTTQPTSAAETKDPFDLARTVTVQDLDEMRAALVTYLRASSLDDRDSLVRLTEKSISAIDADGAKHIGAWRLNAERGGLFLTLRTGGGQQLIVNYRALVERAETAWRISGIRTQFVNVR